MIASQATENTWACVSMLGIVATWSAVVNYYYYYRSKKK